MHVRRNPEFVNQARFPLIEQIEITLANAERALSGRDAFPVFILYYPLLFLVYCEARRAHHPLITALIAPSHGSLR